MRPPPSRKKKGFSKGEFYRQSRMWHGYLSAVAFLALMFFAATGLTLNHPEWFKSDGGGKTTTKTVELAPSERSQDPEALAKAVGRKASLRGAYQSGEVIDGETMIRTEGVTGSSDVTVDLATGKAEVVSEAADVVTTLNELHRGKNAGGAWKLIIDLAAALVLSLSLIGYVLFFSLRFRLRTSLILTGVSLGAMLAVFFLLVP